MGDTGSKLADYMIGGYFLYGQFRLKRKLTVIHCIVFPLLLVSCSIGILPVFLRVSLIVLFIPGMLITICLIFWIPRAVRVSRAVGRLEKRGACEEALREIEENGKPYYRKEEAVFGSRYLFLFSSGTVLAYHDIAKLKIEANYDKPNALRHLIINDALWARLTDGKWLPLAYTAAGRNRGLATLQPLRKYASEIMKHNPAIEME